MQVLIVGALPESIPNFRGGLIRALVRTGVTVTCMTSPANEGTLKRIEELGVTFRPYSISRNSISVRDDIRTVKELRNAFMEIRPDIVLAYTIKPIVWAGIALFFMRSVAFHALIEGLGYAFYGAGFKRRIISIIATALYKVSLTRAQSVIFLNEDNLNSFVTRRIVSKTKCHTIAGTGVNLELFPFTPLPEGDFVFLTIARLLGEKGLRELAAAARIVKSKCPSTIIRLVGPADPSPDGISLSEVTNWQRDGLIEYLGEMQDVRPALQSCHVYVLPSYHEGMPRTVLEALATGRAVITTTAPGCRHSIIDGQQGFLIAPQSAQSLADAMLKLLQNPRLVVDFGKAARERAIATFSEDKVNKMLLDIIGMRDEAHF
jgi:glycosyltransferase involved in cell wall biosynthesis